MGKKKISNWLGESVPSGAKLEKDPNHDYETKGHMSTLIEAHGIMSDPEKMKKVHKLVGRHAKAIRSIQDLKDARDHFSKKATVVDADEDQD